MGVVDRKMLHRYMSEPRWTNAQEAEADRLCAAVEVELSGALFGAVISPVPRNEVVGVSREGMVSTSLPIAQLLTLNGAVIYTDEVPGGGPTNLPSGYSYRDHRLWQDVGAAGFGVPAWDRWDLARSPFGGGPFYTGVTVALTYLGGWGPEPALVEAILRKARVRMSGAHADTVVLTGLNASPANQQTRESPNFTDDDLKALGRYRNLGWAS